MVSGDLREGLRETLAIFESRGEQGEPLTTNEVTDELDVSRRSTYDRLEKLVEMGHLRTKKAGARGRIWWQPPDPRDAPDDHPASVVHDLSTVVYRCRNEPGWPMQYVSEGCRRLTGYDAAAVEAGDVSWGGDLVHPEDVQHVRDRVRAGLDRDGRFSLQYRILTADGEPRWVWERGRETGRAPDGTVILEGLITDITELKQQARHLEHEIDEVFERVDDAFYAVDEEFRFTYVNERAEELLRRDEDELLGESVWDAFPEATETEVWDAFHEALETQEQTSFELYYEPLGFWVEASVYPSPTGLSVYFRDISDRKARERELEQYETIVETVDDGIYVVDEDGRFRMVNDAYTELTGYARSELLGEPISLVVDDEVVEQVRTTEATMREGHIEGAVMEVELETAAGDRLPVEVTFAMLPAADGSRRRVGVVRDVSERKERRRELEKSRRRYRAIVENFPNGAIALVDEDLRYRTTGGTPVDEEADTADDLAGSTVREAISPELADVLEPKYRAALDGESSSFEYEHGDNYSRFHVFPVRDDDGEVFAAMGMSQDVTEQKRRERELERTKERYRSLADNFPNGGVGVYDEDLRYTLVTGTMWDDIEPDAADLEGETVRDALPPETADDVEPIFRGALEGESGTVVSQLGGRTYRVWATPLRDADGAIVGGQSFALDITEQLEREQQLAESERRYRTLAEYFPNGIVTLFDHDLEYKLAAGRAFDHISAEPEDVEGHHFREAWDAEAAAALEPAFEAALEGEERSIEVDYEGREWVVRVVPITDERGDVYAGMTMAQDITERKEREHELEMFETVARTASDVIVTIDTDSVVQDVNPAVADVFGYDPDELIGESLTTLMPDELVDQHLDAVSEYLAEEVRHLDWEYLELPGVRADGAEIPLAISFSDYEHGDERYFTGIIRDITERKERERELVHQREQLSALNSLNEVVRDITEAVVEQSTREEIEATVCERLATAESYEFAWIGDVDRATDSLEVRTEAGARDYLDEITITVDPDDPRGRGPTATALRTGEIQTVDDVDADPDYEPWRETATEYEIESSAAIPIVHEGTVYGVLNVYASRPNAFEGQERTVIEQLGEVVGHAIAAVERKRALMSDEVVELQFRIPDVFDALDVDAAEAGRITLDQVVPVADEEFLVYGTATADAVDDVRAIVDAVPHWDDVTFHDDEGDTTFELRLTEPPVLSTLAALGGSVEEVVIEEGDYHMTLQLSPTADSRRLIETVQEAYPVAEMMTRRQVARSDETAEGLDRSLVDRLTDRQLTALRAAYHAGFFEWPRDTSGEDLAASLDVSAPTFHQHLRKAEKKVFDALLGEMANPARADD